MAREFGEIKFVNSERGFLFIEREGRSDLFCHVSKFRDFAFCKDGDKVSFEVGEGVKGPEAVGVELVPEGEAFSERTSPTLKLLNAHHALRSRINGHDSKPTEHPELSKTDEPPNFIKEGYHFYKVYDPVLSKINEGNYCAETQAHSFNKKLRDNEFLYWGKYKASRGNAKLNFGFFEQVVEVNNRAGISTILYISDYTYFWAAKVEGVFKQLDKVTESKNTLHFYFTEWDNIEFWFKITDMALLSADQMETNRFIKTLSIKTSNNLNSMDPLKKELFITPYTSNLRYPLIIENNEFEDLFKDEEARVVDGDNPLLLNGAESERVHRIIQSYLIPKAI
ncbi:MAG: cold shock domain-containing protein, partial [Bacteriovoracaceae bacterium]|nr:cold shock domain-containing protein [Bacteriovoracaceae bacterium]